MLTANQWKLMKAIATENMLYQPTEKEFIRKYDLGSSAGVLRCLKSLLKYELIYEEIDENKVKYYSVYDVFFMRWVQTYLS